MRFVIAIAAVLLLAGCAGEDALEPGPAVGERGRSATPPYDGPLDIRAAVAALECDGRSPYLREEARYDEGLASVQWSAEAALNDYMRQSGLSFIAPSAGYVVEREQAGRALFSYDVDGRTKMALVAADDVRDFDADEGWGLLGWAQCDPSELPPDVTNDLNIGVWEDETGGRVPVTRIQSFQGAEHCAWTDITFLLLGPQGKEDWYVRDIHGEFAALLRTTFSDEASLPEGATDTGFHRGGRELWIGPDEKAAYLVSLDDAEDVERWPAARQALLCA